MFDASIDEVPSAERDISSLTLCLGPEALAEVKRRVQAFRRERRNQEIFDDSKPPTFNYMDNFKVLDFVENNGKNPETQKP